MPAGPEGGADAVEQALSDLKATEPYRRSDKRRELVKLGVAAVPRLVGEVNRFRQETDHNYIANCALALGEIAGVGGPERRAATAALIPALRAPSAEIRYAAAVGLGGLWDGAGQQDVETLRAVNAALVAALFEASVDAEVYGPGPALFEINDIGVPDSGGVSRPTSLAPTELRDQVAAWAATHPEALPPLEQQPWQLLVARITRSADPAVRAEARALLVRVKPLEAVEMLLRYLGSDELAGPLWSELGDILTELTGVEFPPQGSGGERRAAVELWTQRWDEQLKTRRDEAHRAYSWERFERAVARASSAPGVEALERVEQLREILICQFDSLESVPEDASPSARELVEEVLSAKQQFIEALAGLEQASTYGQKLTYVKKLEEVAEGEGGNTIVRQFLDKLTAIMRVEDSDQILNRLARLLTPATGVPLLFDSQFTLRERNNAIDMWLQMVREYEAGTEEG